RFVLQGAAISKITQRIAYKGIRKWKTINYKEKVGTKESLEEIRNALAKDDCQPADHIIWNSIKKDEIRRPIQLFLWKIIHRANKCGDYWFGKGEAENRMYCSLCLQGRKRKYKLETIEHILTECKKGAQKDIWEAA
ncbi:hypothetical protein SISSUDRAFT_963312, partial [Sistotremastrum suecicum HHB10207 ss-3]